MRDLRLPSTLAALAATAALLFVWPRALAGVFASDFLPQAQCYLWQPGLIGLHLITDTAIGLSYVVISFTLIYFVRRRVDLPFNRMFVAFGVFIIAGAATHLMEVWTLWQPVYWLAGAVKLVTALASVATALLLPPLIPRALALPSPTALARANTELAQEVAERRAAEAKVRALLESAPEGILLVDAAGAIELLNERAGRMFGYAPSELRGHAIARLLPDAFRDAQPQRRGLEVQAERRDGSRFPAEISVSPLVTAEGAMTTVVVRDVTEPRRVEEERADRARAEAARAQAEEAGRRASFLAEASRVLAGSLDYEATIKSVARVAIPYLADYVLVDALDADGRLHRLAAAHADPLTEERLARRPPPLHLPADSVMGAVVQRGEPTLVRDITAEWLGARPVDAEHLGLAVGARATSLMLVPLRARGRTLGIATFALGDGPRRYTLADLALAEDLAQRAAFGADNARLYREAHDASRAKDEFLAVLSHELRTPLTPVLGWIRMLRSGMLPPATMERALDTIERNTRLQVQLVEDLLDVSRIITGKLKLEVRQIQIGAVVELAVESVRAAAAAKSITLTYQVAEGLPAVHADTNRLQQVLANLLSNAVKFTPEGGRVQLVASAAGDRVRLTVTDTGDGLSPDVAPHIFDRFHQADSTITRHHGGLGLGLSIVRHIVEQHGGSVHASSAGPGQGTTFTVLLPLAGPALRLDVTTPPGEAAPPLAFPADALAGVRVLIVDDEPDSRDLVAAVLERSGADVALAASADEALQMVDKYAPDVLVSDLAMPGRDGYALLRELRARGQTTGVTTVALSAQARAEDRVRALAAGYDAHVSKPVEPAALAMLLSELVVTTRRRRS